MSGARRFVGTALKAGDEFGSSELLTTELHRLASRLDALHVVSALDCGAGSVISDDVRRLAAVASAGLPTLWPDASG